MDEGELGERYMNVAQLNGLLLSGASLAEIDGLPKSSAILTDVAALLSISQAMSKLSIWGDSQKTIPPFFQPVHLIDERTTIGRKAQG